MNLTALKSKIKNYHLWQTIKKHAKNNTIILVFANYGYRHVLDVWLNSIKQCGVTNYLIISLDREMQQYLTDNKTQTYLFNIDNDFAEIMIHRTDFILKTLNLGFNVIHSDADAIWCDDPQSEYFNFDQHDLVFSQGTIFPPEIHDKWGFVLCGGLYGIKPGNKTRQLVEKVLKDVRISKNDQRSFNRVLYEKKISWQTKETYSLSFRGRSVQCAESTIEGASDEFKIALLPHKLFQRLEEDAERIYVKHWLLSREKLVNNESI